MCSSIGSLASPTTSPPPQTATFGWRWWCPTPRRWGRALLGPGRLLALGRPAGPGLQLVVSPAPPPHADPPPCAQPLASRPGRPLARLAAAQAPVGLRAQGEQGASWAPQPAGRGGMLRVIAPPVLPPPPRCCCAPPSAACAARPAWPQVSPQGEVLHCLMDPDGSHVSSVACAVEHGGKLFMGSLAGDCVSVLDLAGLPVAGGGAAGAAAAGGAAAAAAPGCGGAAAAAGGGERGRCESAAA